MPGPPSPIHVLFWGRLLHEKLERRAHVAGDVTRLYFDGAEVSDSSALIVSDENDIDVACRLALPVIQPDFDKRRPLRFERKEEACGLIRNQPVLPKANRAGDGNRLTVANAAHAERIIRFVFRAIRHFVVEGAQTLAAMAHGFLRLVVCWITEDLGKRMLGHAPTFLNSNDARAILFYQWQELKSRADRPLFTRQHNATGLLPT